MIRSWWRWRQRCRWWWWWGGGGEHFTDQFSKRGVHLEIDDGTVLRNNDPVVATGGTRPLHVPVEGVLKVRVLHPSLVHRIAASCKCIPRPWAIFKNIHKGGHVTSMDHFREHSPGRSRHVYGPLSRTFTREVTSRPWTTFENIHQGGHVTSMDHSQEHSPGRSRRVHGTFSRTFTREVTSRPWTTLKNIHQGGHIVHGITKSKARLSTVSTWGHS